MTVLTICEIQRKETFEVYDDGSYFVKTVLSLELLDEDGDSMPLVVIDKSSLRQYGKHVLDHLLDIMYRFPGYEEACAYPASYRNFELEIKPTQRILIQRLMSSIYGEQ